MTNNGKQLISLQLLVRHQQDSEKQRETKQRTANIAEIPRLQLFNGKPVFLKKSFMASALKYMIDEKGQKTSVLVPIKTWAKINEDYNKLQTKLNFIVGLREAFNEVKSAKKSGKKL